MSEQIEFTGGCLCGKIRYHILGKPLIVGNCHCSICRRFTGSAFATWAAFNRENFTFTSGEPSRFSYSPKATRLFCDRCGSSVGAEAADYPSIIGIFTGSTDNPDDFPPQFHQWTSNRLSWLHVNDDLPDYREFPNSSAPAQG